MEPHKIFPMVSIDIDVLVIRGDEGSHERSIRENIDSSGLR